MSQGRWMNDADKAGLMIRAAEHLKIWGVDVPEENVDASPYRLGAVREKEELIEDLIQVALNLNPNHPKFKAPVRKDQ